MLNERLPIAGEPRLQFRRTHLGQRARDRASIPASKGEGLLPGMSGKSCSSIRAKERLPGPTHATRRILNLRLLVSGNVSQPIVSFTIRLYGLGMQTMH